VAGTVRVQAASAAADLLGTGHEAGRDATRGVGQDAMRGVGQDAMREVGEIATRHGVGQIARGSGARRC
jgi:hypothetical protein